jgi:hypothetical protein
MGGCDNDPGLNFLYRPLRGNRRRRGFLLDDDHLATFTMIGGSRGFYFPLRFMPVLRTFNEFYLWFLVTI